MLKKLTSWKIILFGLRLNRKRKNKKEPAKKVLQRKVIAMFLLKLLMNLLLNLSLGLSQHIASLRDKSMTSPKQKIHQFNSLKNKPRYQLFSIILSTLLCLDGRQVWATRFRNSKVMIQGVGM